MKLSEQAKQQDIPKVAGKHFSAVHVGKFADLLNYELIHPARPKPVKGKLFLKDHLGLTSMQVSMNHFPPGIATPFNHAHKEDEELYIFVGGKGQMSIDGECFDVEEGTCVRVSTPGERSWRNNSDQNLYFIVIQAKENSLGQDTFDDGKLCERKPEWIEK